MPETGRRSGKRARQIHARQMRELRKALIKAQAGGLKPIAANVTTALRLHPDWRGVLIYDGFAHAVRTTRPPPWHAIDAPAKRRSGEWTDQDTSRLVNWLARELGLHVRSTDVEHALAVAAHARMTHPVRDYLRALRWDRKKRLDTFASEYLGAKDTEYSRLVGAKWMIAAVARAMRPGCQVDNTLILETLTQGQRKSSALRALVPDDSWFGETPIEIGNKDSYQALRGKWIYALDELDSTRRAEQTKVKSFLTSRIDSYRPSYGRRTQDFPRHTIFCGSTDQENYLPDRAGNRRYWPLRIKRADTVALERDRDQLWAEAYKRWKRGETWWDDTPEFRALCEAEQADRELPDDWESIIAEWVRRYDDGRGVLTLDILTRSRLHIEPDRITAAHTQRCAAVLRNLSYERAPQRREEGKRVRRYRLDTRSKRETQAEMYKNKSIKNAEKTSKSSPGVTLKNGGYRRTVVLPYS
jgi:putative DNA primase/helicase